MKSSFVIALNYFHKNTVKLNCPAAAKRKEKRHEVSCTHKINKLQQQMLKKTKTR